MFGRVRLAFGQLLAMKYPLHLLVLVLQPTSLSGVVEIREEDEKTRKRPQTTDVETPSHPKFLGHE